MKNDYIFTKKFQRGKIILHIFHENSRVIIWFIHTHTTRKKRARPSMKLGVENNISSFTVAFSKCSKVNSKKDCKVNSDSHPGAH